LRIEERVGARSTNDRISGAALGDARQATDPELMMLCRKRRFGNDRGMNGHMTLPSGDFNAENFTPEELVVVGPGRWSSSSSVRLRSRPSVPAQS
jgi:hypothetical protein